MASAIAKFNDNVLSLMKCGLPKQPPAPYLRTVRVSNDAPRFIHCLSRLLY